MDSTRYAILFRDKTGYVNDIQIILSSTSAVYKDTLQTAFNKIFTIPPYVLVTVELDFDNVYTIPVIESIIEDVTGEDSGYTVVFSFENKKAVFTIALDSELAQYENEIRIALEAHFAGANDVVIDITQLLRFDNIPSIVPNPNSISFSTDRNVIIGSQVITPSMGGKFD